MDGETDQLTLNQVHNLEIIISMLTDEILSNSYNSKRTSELKEALEILYYVIGENNAYSNR